MESKVEEGAILLARLFLFQQSKNQPLKREIIKTFVMDKLGLPNNRFDEVMEKANENMKKSFSMSIERLPTKTGHQFTLVNSHPKRFKKLVAELDKTRKGFDEIGLLGLLLSFIAMSDNKLLEGELSQIFSKFGIDMNADHKDFGDPSQLLAKWVKTLYLEKSKGTGSVAATNESFYSWGPRAYVEFPLEKLCVFIAKIYGTSEVSQLEKHLKRSFPLLSSSQQ